MSEFFKNSIESKFIKYLLSYTPLPIFPTISSDDTIIEGCIYIYKDKIIKCTKTGRFNGINANEFIDDHLYVNENLVITDDDYVLRHYNPKNKKYDIFLPDEGKEGGKYYDNETGKWINKNIPGIGGLTVTDDIVRYYYRPVAEYEILDDYSFGESFPNITQRFISNVSYYDTETHRFLGEYLRCLRDIYGLDLMPLYNCFDYDSTDKFSLTADGIVEEQSLKSKVLLVPIKFNKTYTIAIDCDFPVLVKSVFYKDNLLKDIDNSSFTDLLHENVTRFNGLRFSSPVTYTISNDTSADFYMSNNTFESEEQFLENEKKSIERKKEVDKILQEHEKYLYLAIQLPKTNASSIVVIEGDFSSIADNYIASAEGINKLSDRQLSLIFRSKLSLLNSNTEKQIPYSDKLISYLLQYTIDCREQIDENVETIETEINYHPPLEEFVKGIWDVDLRYTLYNRYMNLKNIDWITKLDILGFVDKDIENAAYKGLISNGIQHN